MRQLAGLCALILLAQLSAAQNNIAAKAISEADARQHLTQKSDPVYPPIAAAAHVEGDVVISVVIDTKGQVASEKVLSGPAMLDQAALDAVKKWTFSPFAANGAVEQVNTTLTIPFHLEHHGPQPTADQEQAAQALFPLADKCRGALRAQNTQDALDQCKQALDMSLRAGDLTNSDQLGRLDAHQLYGHALLSAGRPQEALEQENLAIAESRKCLSDKDEEYAIPFFWRAAIEAHLGQNEAALADFTTAEASERKAILNLPDMKSRYGQELASMLKQHAALLDMIGKSADAAKLRAEAGSL
ncbi:MAG: energy transducer TonB [Terracidiphilus sp.]